MHPYVVGDVDHRGDLGADLPGISTHADEESGAADTPGEDHDPHEAIFTYRYDETSLAPQVYAEPTLNVPIRPRSPP
jgi:hypothetical protein